MNEQMTQTKNFAKLARYSLMLSVLSIISLFTIFPSGIYYSFPCAAIGVAGGLLCRPYLERKGSCTASVVLGVIAILICAVSFHGIHSLYTMIKDPVAGPQITQYISNILNQYGVSIDMFAQLMKP